MPTTPSRGTRPRVIGRGLRFLASVAIWRLLLAVGCGSPRLDAVVAPDGGDEPPGRGFTVVGTRILDPAGREFVPKGVAINGPNGPWSRDMTADADYIAGHWRFNLVRAEGRILAGAGARGTNSPDALVRAFTSRKVVVVFSPRDQISGYYTASSRPSLAELVAWHKDLAARYRDNPYVWLEVMGAPGDCSPSQEWLTMHQAVVRAVRDEMGAPNVIVAQGWSWGADDACMGGDVSQPSRSAVLTHGPQLLSFGGRTYQDIVFSFAVFSPRTRARIEAYLDAVHARGLAIFAARYAGKHYKVDGQNFTNIESGVDALFAVAVPRRVGRVAYHWYAGDTGPEFSNQLTAGPNGSTGSAIDDVVAPTNLSWLGRIAWDDTHRSDGL